MELLGSIELTRTDICSTTSDYFGTRWRSHTLALFLLHHHHSYYPCAAQHERIRLGYNDQRCQRLDQYWSGILHWALITDICRVWFVHLAARALDLI
jgi:hypothetical protein